MTKHEKIIEYHKRAAKRNLFNNSEVEKKNIKDKYKPTNLRDVLKLKTP